MSENELFERYKIAVRKLILLDYDGTLVNHISQPEKAIPSKHLMKILEELCNAPQTKLVVVTGRQKKEIEKFLGSLPIDIIAEHGAVYKKNDTWNDLIFENATWKDDVGKLLKEITLQCPESRVEEKQFSYTWHYRDSELGYDYSRKLINWLKPFSSKFNLKLIDGNKVVEIMSSGIGKGNAITNLIELGYFDFILAIGDDLADEEMFRVLEANQNSFTIKVGEGATMAKLKINSVVNVVKLLSRLSELNNQKIIK